MKRHILIVPDKFKGSATARQVADELEKAFRSRAVFGRNDKKLTIEKLPMADGGDGSLEVLEMVLNNLSINGNQSQGIVLTEYTCNINDVSATHPIINQVSQTNGDEVSRKKQHQKTEQNPETIEFSKQTVKKLFIPTVDALRRPIEAPMLILGGTASDETDLGETTCSDTASGETACSGTAPGETAYSVTAHSVTTSSETALGGTASDETDLGDTASGDTACSDTVSSEKALGDTAPGGTAFIEMAKVCGLAMLKYEERNPETATTFGLGLMLKAAAEMGVGKIILGIGGSATNDGGAGILEACPPEKLADIEILVACDVDNPLLGPNGATMVYAPQKGADEPMLERLERRMEEFAKKTGLDPNYPGGGAAGGVGAMMHSVYGAKLTPGWKIFSEMTNLEQRIEKADLVVTAEGRFDGQSLSGKLIDGIATLCRKHRKPLKIICGKCQLPPKEWKSAGIKDVLALSEIEPDIRKSKANTPKLLSGEGVVVAGCDEAGRGCLAGPVFAAAVILPEGFYDERLNDSKQMSEADRDALRAIIEKEAVAWKVVAVSAEEIDRINILNASITGMHRALDGLETRPQMIMVDGNRFMNYRSPDGTKIPHHCVVHGDACVAAIAAASVLAKTHRDEYMRKIALEYPQYGWDRNMAYPTAEHRDAIRRYGITPYHRRSYTLLPPEEKLLF